MYMCGYYISADKISVGENMEKLKASYIAGGNWTWCSTVDNCLVVPQKIKHGINVCLSSSTPRYISQPKDVTINWIVSLPRQIHMLMP